MLPPSSSAPAGAPSVLVAATQQVGGEPTHILARALEDADFWKLLASRRASRRGAKRDLAIALKPDLDIFVPGAPTGTDPALVEALVGMLRARGYSNVTLCDGRNRSDGWLHNREGLCVPDLVGYHFEDPTGEPYEMVWCGDDSEPVPLHQGDRGEALLVNAAWTRADVRISFAKAKTDDGWGYVLSLANLLGLVPADAPAARWSAEDLALQLLRRVPPDFAIIDAIEASHGSAGSRFPLPLDAATVIASASCLLADWAAALKMGVDPHLSRLNRLALEMVGLPEDWALVGDSSQWPGWENPSPQRVAAVQSRTRWPELDELTRAVLQPTDREIFPFRDVVVDQVSATVLSQLDRVADPRLRDAVTGLLARLLAMLAGARFAFVTNVTKGEIVRSEAPLTIDVDTLPATEFDRTPRIVAAQLRAVEGAPVDARGFRFRTIGGHTHFFASRVLPRPFDAFVEKVDISAGIRLMNDYLGGSWVVVEADESGRPRRQAERNIYLPQPNWIGAVGGDPIDVEKVERVEHGRDRHELWWRTVRSPNGSAESDDGLVAFHRTPADEVEVRIFARQRFRLPPPVAALGVERWPALHEELVADAYARFFEGTLANMQAAFEGRPYRIGRPAAVSGPERSELRAVLAGAFAVLARVLGWAPAGGVTATPLPGVLAEPLFVDDAGFTHFPGQPVPAFVSASQSEPVVAGEALTPAIFLMELGRAVGRDLAALRISDMNGSGRNGEAMDAGAAWAAAHLGIDPFAPAGNLG